MTTSVLTEQRAIIKFCVKLKKTETMRMIMDAGNDSNAGKTTMYKWHKSYREGRESWCDDTSPPWTFVSSDSEVRTVCPKIR